MIENTTGYQIIEVKLTTGNSTDQLNSARKILLGITSWLCCYMLFKDYL